MTYFYSFLPQIYDLFQKAMVAAKREYIAERRFFKTIAAARISHENNDPANVDYRELGECLIVKHDPEQNGSPRKKPEKSHFCIFENQDLPTHVLINPKDENKTAYARIKYMAKGEWHDPFELDINGKFV